MIWETFVKYLVGRIADCRARLSLADLHEADLRTTNKSEPFNGFAKWLFFGGEGTIASNDRAEQRKIIKYNHSTFAGECCAFCLCLCGFIGSVIEA